MIVRSKMSSNIARGYISRAGIINHCLALLRVLIEGGSYMRKYGIHFFYLKIKVINFKNSDFCKLLRLFAISALQLSKNILQYLIFCKNETCVNNCGTLNVITLIWLRVTELSSGLAVKITM